MADKANTKEAYMLALANQKAVAAGKPKPYGAGGAPKPVPAAKKGKK